MKVSRAWLQTYFDKPIPAADKLAELFTFHSFEVESIEGINSGNADKGGRLADSILDVKILPDRAHYCLSHRGVAEEVSVLTGTPFASKKSAQADIPSSIDRMPVVAIEDPAFCRRFTGRFVEGIDEGIDDNVSGLVLIATSLETIGQRSISPVVDVTNFVMFDIGQPTHAFDADKIVGNILIRAAKAGEKITLLDGKEYALTADDHVIADDAGPLDIAGVKGGKRAEVTATTRSVLLTSANFSPSAVRRTSTRLNLRNEASKRFENEITPELAIEGLAELSSLLAKIFPSARFGPVVDRYPAKAVRTVIPFDPAYVSKRLGVEIPPATIEDILSRMGVVVKKDLERDPKNAIGKAWSLAIPFPRLDVTIPEDIVEEVGRIYGYEHIQGKLPIKSPADSAPVASVSAASAPEFNFVEKIKDILVDAGFSEVYLYTFAPKGDIAIARPLASDKAYLRATLAAGLKTCLDMNAKNAELLGLDAVKIFEIGKVFTKNAAGTNVETFTLGLGAVQIKKAKGIDGKSLLTAVLEHIKTAVGIEVPVKSLLSSGSSAICEIELDELLEKMPPSLPSIPTVPGSRKISYKPFSLYPFIVRDIAVFVSGDADEKIIWEEIEKGIASADAKLLLVRHTLFDTFAKDGKTSYAFRLVFQSMYRTLTDMDANAIMEKIYARISARGWQTR